MQQEFIPGQKIKRIGTNMDDIVQGEIYTFKEYRNSTKRMLSVEESKYSFNTEYFQSAEELKIEVGDTVERIAKGWNAMKAGDIDTVKAVYSSGISLEKFGSGHSLTKLKIIKKANKITEMKEEKFTITRQDLKSLYDIVCSAWRTKIFDIVNGMTVFENSIEISHDLITEGYKDAESANNSRAIKDLLNTFFPNYKKKVDMNPMVAITTAQSMSISKILFNDSSLMTEATTSASIIGRPELRRRSLYISAEVEVLLHKVGPSGATIIEFVKKQ